MTFAIIPHYRKLAFHTDYLKKAIVFLARYHDTFILFAEEKSMHVHILPFVIPNARAMSIGKCLYVVVGFSVSNAYVGIVI